MREIIKKIKSGELSRENDEKYAGGFWDLSIEIAAKAHQISDEVQEDIYNTLWELCEEAGLLPNPPSGE